MTHCETDSVALDESDIQILKTYVRSIDHLLGLLADSFAGSRTIFSLVEEDRE